MENEPTNEEDKPTGTRVRGRRMKDWRRMKTKDWTKDEDEGLRSANCTREYVKDKLFKHNSFTFEQNRTELNRSSSGSIW